MSDREQAHQLLAMAQKDYKALCGMKDEEVFSTEIFGFHVQQAIEKALKAWLCLLGLAFPRTHDLDQLAALLEDAGLTIPSPWVGLLEYTDFAVAFRYDAFPELEGEIDREGCCEQVRGLLNHVRSILAAQE